MAARVRGVTRMISFDEGGAMLRWRGRTATVALAIGVGLAGCAGDDRWVDGSVHEPWRAVFDGEGTTSMRDGVLTLSPRPATSANETHAGLVVTTASYGDLDFSLRARTVAQLRRSDPPNPWEVAWVVWAYTDPTHFYYVTLKPNGWEIGKADPAYPGAQRFLVTGPVGYPIGTWHTVHVRQVGAALTVSVDDVALAQYTDPESPYPGGSIGAYVEDATADFADLDARAS